MTPDQDTQQELLAASSQDSEATLITSVAKLLSMFLVCCQPLVSMLPGGRDCNAALQALVGKGLAKRHARALRGMTLYTPAKAKFSGGLALHRNLSILAFAVLERERGRVCLRAPDRAVKGLIPDFKTKQTNTRPHVVEISTSKEGRDVARLLQVFCVNTADIAETLQAELDGLLAFPYTAHLVRKHVYGFAILAEVPAVAKQVQTLIHKKHLVIRGVTYPDRLKDRVLIRTALCPGTATLPEWLQQRRTNAEESAHVEDSAQDTATE